MPCQLLRGRLADMANAERIDEAVERDVAAPGDRREQVARARLAETFALHQPMRRTVVALLEREDVLRARDQAFLVEQLDALGAEPFDVEGVARNEMAQPFDRLRRADEPAGAATNHVLLAGARIDLAHRMASAGRAKLREIRRAPRSSAASRRRSRALAGSRRPRAARSPYRRSGCPCAGSRPRCGASHSTRRRRRP